MSDRQNNHRGLDPEITEKLRRQTAELAESVNAGNYARAMSLINELSEVRDQGLYREVGRLTRSLHEAIRNFKIDPRNEEQSEALSKMSDASDRLEYVMYMTSQAANRTLDLVEESMPLALSLRDEAQELREQWQRLRRREMQADEFRGLYRRIDAFFSRLAEDADAMYGNLSEILLAQDYQDLTGQVIQKVMALVREVEDNLLNLVVMASHVDQLTGMAHQLEEPPLPPEKAVGPQIRAERRDDVVSGQDDVDDLLSSLGF